MDSPGAASPLTAEARRDRDGQEFARVVLRRNLLALEVNRPEIRIRAVRYLESSGRSLEGYDPIAPFGDRHAAVSRIWCRLLAGGELDPER
jgi:hypothetical protein